MSDKIEINRAPVLTLWATIVAERLGFSHDEALTLGKAVTGLNAQSKGRRLGIFKPSEEKREKTREYQAGKEFAVEILGRPVPAVNTDDGMRATLKGKPIPPESVERYLRQKFGESLPETRAAMQALAKSVKPKILAARAYALYEQFRPQIPEGTKGWGAKGELDLDQIRSLAKDGS